MNPKLKIILIIAAKNAVNAVLTNTALIEMFRSDFNLTSAHRWYGILKATIAVVASREAMVWGPKLLSWSKGAGNGTISEPVAFRGDGHTFGAVMVPFILVWLSDRRDRVRMHSDNQRKLDDLLLAEKYLSQHYHQEKDGPLTASGLSAGSRMGIHADENFQKIAVQA